MRHIPNILSALRILMVGVFVYFFAKAQYLACLITYVTAFLTDLLDGFLARRNNWISNIGKVLDPLADKLMLLTALVCFLTRGWLPLYMIVIVLAKELIMIIGGAVLFRKKVVVYSDWYGKFASGFFNASVALTLAKRFFSADRHVGRHCTWHCDRARAHSARALCACAGASMHPKGEIITRWSAF